MNSPARLREFTFLHRDYANEAQELLAILGVAFVRKSDDLAQPLLLFNATDETFNEVASRLRHITWNRRTVEPAAPFWHPALPEVVASNASRFNTCPVNEIVYKDARGALRHPSLVKAETRFSQPYQPFTGEPCSCRPGIQRDNCPACEGTGKRVDFAKIRARRLTAPLASATLLLSLLLPLAAHAEPCKVNVQTANVAQVAFLPGIGQVKAGEIVKARPADEAALDAVKGIGESTLAAIRPHVVYTGETTCTSKQTAPMRNLDGVK